VAPRARTFPGLAALLTAAALLASACTRQAAQETYAPPPPPQSEPPQLMGAPTTESMAAAARAERQAEADAYLANLPEGLIVTSQAGADGRTVLVISNRPIPNPARGGHGRSRRASWPLAGGPRTASHSAAPQAAPAPVAAPPPTVPSAASRPSSSASASAAPAPVSRAPASKFNGITLSPGLWVALGVLLLIIVLVSILSGRREHRRSSGHAHGRG
jgi:hypothetical protein